MDRKDQTGKIRTFRLTDDVVAELDRIAKTYTEDLGIDVNRTDALRILVRMEGDRLRKGKWKGKK